MVLMQVDDFPDPFVCLILPELLIVEISPVNDDFLQVCPHLFEMKLFETQP